MVSEEKRIKFDSHLNATQSILNKLKRINGNEPEKEESVEPIQIVTTSDTLENAETVQENISYEIVVPETLDVANQYGDSTDNIRNRYVWQLQAGNRYVR